MSELRLIEREAPEDWIRKARQEHEPILTVCLFSGGSDSLVVAHRCRDYYDELVFIDTTTAVPGVIEHVARCATDLRKPLRILKPDFDAFRLLVLGGTDPDGNEWKPLGFPGPGQHNRAYNRLKERPLRRFLKKSKVGYDRNARVLALSGIRRDESARRSSRLPITREGSMVFCNPLIEWSNAEMAAYRAEHDLRLSDVAAMLHRSGECQCGSFADKGEREMLMSLYPEWWEERIAPIEREAKAMGLEYSTWGSGRPDIPVAAGPMCSSCELRFELEAA